jgi:hypothetical protein
MYMKTIPRPLLLMTVAVLILMAWNLQAQNLPVTFQLKIQQQDFSTFNKGVYNDKTKSMKLTSYDILTLLSGVYLADYPAGFPPGSQLMLVDYSRFQVWDANGNVLITDTAPVLTYGDTYSETNYLYQGKESTSNGSQIYNYFYESTIRFTDPDSNGTSFRFSGNLLEKYSKSPLYQSGERMYQDSLTLNGYGSGKTGNNFFLLSGRITTPMVTWIE